MAVSRRRGPPALTREEWAERYWQKHAEVQEVRQENRRIQRALDAILMLRSRIRDEVADSVAEEIEALSDKLEECQEALLCAEEAVEDRPLMLRALGWDEFEWERRKWAL